VLDVGAGEERIGGWRRMEVEGRMNHIRSYLWQ